MACFGLPNIKFSSLSTYTGKGCIFMRSYERIGSTLLKRELCGKYVNRAHNVKLSSNNKCKICTEEFIIFILRGQECMGCHS